MELEIEKRDNAELILMVITIEAHYQHEALAVTTGPTDRVYLVRPTTLSYSQVLTKNLRFLLCGCQTIQNYHSIVERIISYLINDD